jgi:hypothetical protein
MPAKTLGPPSARRSLLRGGAGASIETIFAIGIEAIGIEHAPAKFLVEGLGRGLRLFRLRKIKGIWKG